MHWSYKFAFDEIEEMMENRPWLLVGDDFASSDNDTFLGIQRRLMLARGWDWFARVIRGRVYPKLGLTTITALNQERNPDQGDIDPESVAKVQQKFPGVSVVSLVGVPHVVSGPPIGQDGLSRIAQCWSRGLNKMAMGHGMTAKYAANNGRLNKLWSDAWKIMGGAGAGAALAWVLTLMPAPQVQQQLENGVSPQEIITQATMEAPPPQSQISTPNPTEADFAENSANSPEVVDNSPKTDRMSRGLRNNNPGNLERNNIAWQGMAEDQTDERFITFSSPEYGIRAMARVLKNYGRRHGLRTIEQIISRWAPASENQTDSYIQHVSQKLDIPPATPLNLDDDALLGRLIRVIIEHENGTIPYDDETIAKGVQLEKSSSANWSYVYGASENG